MQFWIVLGWFLPEIIAETRSEKIVCDHILTHVWKSYCDKTNIWPIFDPKYVDQRWTFSDDRRREVGHLVRASGHPHQLPGWPWGISWGYLM